MTDVSSYCYKCKRCGYQTNVKYNLIAHLKRKLQCHAVLEDIPCNILLHDLALDKKDKSDKPYTCIHCGKTYSHSSTKYAHMRVCKENANEQNDLKKEIEEMRRRIAELEAKPQTVTYVTNNNIGNTNVQLNAFGNERVDYLTKDLLTKCFINKQTGFTKLIEHIYCHQEHPENHTVKIANKKDGYMQTYNGSYWENKQRDSVLDEMINNGKNVLEEHVADNENDIKKQCRNTELFEEAIKCLNGIREVLVSDMPATKKYEELVKNLRKDLFAVVLTCTQIQQAGFALPHDA
jgi:hypothetical protein